MLKRSWIASASLLALLLVLASCTTPATTTSPAATAVPSTPAATATPTAACQALTTARQVLTSLAAVGNNTTVAEVESMQQKLTTAINSLETRIPGTPGPGFSDLQFANAQLGETLKDVPPDETLGQALPQLATIKEKATTGLAAATRLSAVLKCAL